MKLSANKIGTLSVIPQIPTELRGVPRRIQITDGNLSLVAKGFGQLEKLKLPAGVYRALVESTEKPFEQIVFVPPGQEVSVTYPVQDQELLPSAAPVPGAEAMHEYMRIPLDQVVTQPAFPSNPCRILFMATQRSRGGPSINFDGLRLLNAGGKEVGHMATNATSPTQNEWKMFSQDVDEGGWLLEGPGANFGPQTCIRQPVWCSPGWSTLIFVGVNSTTRLPVLEEASIYFWRTGRSFAPEEHSETRDSWNTGKVMESQRYTELALRSLVNGRNLLSMEEVDTNLLVEKFSNPMLGILGCHLLLQRTTKDEKLIRTVLRNLSMLVPDDPDVIALEAMARQAGVKGLRNKLPSVSWPPMLREGFTALRDEDWRKPGTIAPGSMCDRVRTRVLSGGVWTRWIGEKDGKEFITRAAKPSAASRAGPEWRKLSDITGSFQSTSRNLLSYTKQLLEQRGKKPHADDLRWTGMSRRQATAALSVMKDEAVVRSQSVARKAAARVSLKKAAKKVAKAKSKRAFRARASKAPGQKFLGKKWEHARRRSRSGRKSSAAASH
jgi:hypothetical protein